MSLSSSIEVMKSFLVFCVLVGVLQVRCAPLSLEQKQKLEVYHKECLGESNVSETVIEKSRKGIYSEDPAFKNYLYCFSKKLGFQDASGVVQKDVFERKVSGLVDDKAVLSKLVEQCTVQQNSPENTSFNIAKCLREVAPTIEIFKVAPETIYLSNEKTQKFLRDHQECAAQDALDDQVIEQARKQGVLFDDPKFKNYMYCFFKKQGIQREDGTADKDVIYKCFQDVIEDKALVEKLVQKCVQDQDTPENTSFFLSKCFYENSPVHVELFPREIAVPDDLAQEIIANSRACIKETGVDKEALEKTRHGVYSDDPQMKEFTFCLAKKSGYLSESGELQIEVLREKTLKLINDSLVVQKLIDQCAVKKETPQETAFNSYVCFYKNSPGHLSIVQFGAISEGQKEKRRQIIKECSEESGVSRSVVLSARKGDFQDDPLLKQYFLCINKKSGALNEAGEYNTDAVRKGLTEVFNAGEADRLVKKCVKNQDNPLNTSFEGLKCFFNEIPEANLVF